MGSYEIIKMMTFNDATFSVSYKTFSHVNSLQISNVHAKEKEGTQPACIKVHYKHSVMYSMYVSFVASICVVYMQNTNIIGMLRANRLQLHLGRECLNKNNKRGEIVCESSVLILLLL